MKRSILKTFMISVLDIGNFSCNKNNNTPAKDDNSNFLVTTSSVYPYGLAYQLHANSASVNTPIHSSYLMEPIGTSGANHQFIVPNIASANDFANQYFFDSNAADGGDGTKENPFNSIDFIMNQEYPDDCALLLKSGSVFKMSYLKAETNRKKIYFGAYGEGDMPIVTNVNSLENPTSFTETFTICGEDVTVDGLHLVGGATDTYSRLLNISPKLSGGTRVEGGYNITFANNHIESISVSGSGYCFNIIKGGCENLTLYKNEIAYSRDDIWYASSRYSNYKIISNYFHHANQNTYNVSGMDIMDRETWRYGTGDVIQYEYEGLHGVYIANNFFDRSDSAGKFCLVFNSHDDASDIVIEYNTFLNPVDIKGGACILWNTFGVVENNLFINVDPQGGVGGIASYPVYISEVENNDFVGYETNAFYGVSQEEMPSSNTKYKDQNTYKENVTDDERRGSSLFYKENI
jgi:hypothetical protein